MNIWELPTSLNVAGTDYKIRSDFRAILDILKYFRDPNYDNYEKWEICFTILYEDYENMPPCQKEKAAEAALSFIDAGMPKEEKKKPSTMDWEQDGPVIIPAVNKIMGKEIRSVPYLHWWTFTGAYMEIGDSLFKQVLSIRQKKKSGEHLEKWENKFYQDNKALCDLKEKYTDAELKEQERLLRILDGEV